MSSIEFKLPTIGELPFWDIVLYYHTAMQGLFDIAQRYQETLRQYELEEYNSDNDILRSLNTTMGNENIKMPGYPRQCYHVMPPMHGMPVLPDGVYPVDYNDLSTLSEERANLLMASFDLNGPDNKNATAGIMDKIINIAGFMGVWMRDEFLDEYDKREAMQKVSGGIR